MSQDLRTGIEELRRENQEKWPMSRRRLLRLMGAESERGQQSGQGGVAPSPCPDGRSQGSALEAAFSANSQAHLISLSSDCTIVRSEGMSSVDAGVSVPSSSCAEHWSSPGTTTATSGSKSKHWHRRRAIGWCRLLENGVRLSNVFLVATAFAYGGGTALIIAGLVGGSRVPRSPGRYSERIDLLRRTAVNANKGGRTRCYP